MKIKKLTGYTAGRDEEIYGLNQVPKRVNGSDKYHEKKLIHLNRKHDGHRGKAHRI